MESTKSVIVIEISSEGIKVKLSDVFKNDLMNSTNPVVVLAIGQTRQGKSTLLNEILIDKTNGNMEKLMEDPLMEGFDSYFVSGDGFNPVTGDFSYYGPLKKSELCRRNNLEFDGNERDFFIIDSEGADNIVKMSKTLYIGCFALMSIVSNLIYVSKAVTIESSKFIQDQLLVSKVLNPDGGQPNVTMVQPGIGINNLNRNGTFEEQNQQRKIQDEELKKSLQCIFNNSENQLDINFDCFVGPKSRLSSDKKLLWQSIHDISQKLVI